MQDLLTVFMLFVVFYATYLFYRYLTRKDRKDIYFQRVCESVHQLEDLVNELENLEEIITDLQSCDKRHLKAIYMSVPSAVGKMNECGIIVDGSDYSGKRFLEIALNQREKKRSSLLSGIEELYKNGVTKAVTKAIENDESDEGGEDE